MSSRRMFSKRIVGATRFVRMPATSQNLYFHLGINADDDGVVEAYPVMRMIGASDDDLRVLVAKEFVTILNDDYAGHYRLSETALRICGKYKVSFIPGRKCLSEKQGYVSFAKYGRRR